MRPRAPIDGGRCASRRSTFCQQPRRPFRGAPVRPALALSAEGLLLESSPSSNRTAAIINPLQGGVDKESRKIFNVQFQPHTHTFVTAGLDPAIHLPRNTLAKRDGCAGLRLPEAASA